MLYSMTGFGKATGEFQGRTYTIDIRTLNGKATEIRLKTPNHFRPKEIELRSYIMERARRGRIDFTAQMTSVDDDLEYKLNLKLIETYYKQLSDIAVKYKMPSPDFLQTIIRIPNVVMSKEDEIADDEWQFVLGLVTQAIDELDLFRIKEGQALKEDLRLRTQAIIDLQASIIPYEEQRKLDQQNRLQKLIKDNLTNENADKNRLEQEIIYYLEKLDIHEEKVRLKQHCDYFMEELESDDYQVGKKLNFISQEMGREINTIGSKAQYSQIQQIVVQMKVELDQIKEQLANVL